MEINVIKSTEIISIMNESGVVGAGGAGFPTGTKYSKPLDLLIVNGAECEPLLYKDKELMRCFAQEFVSGLLSMVESGLIKTVIIALKAKAYKAIAALNKVLDENVALIKNRISLRTLGNFYPSGDEIVLINEILDKPVPYGNLPSKLNVVVNNPETCFNIFQSLAGIPVIDKFLTISGAVSRPVTMKVPLGISLNRILPFAGKFTVQNPVFLKNGVMMGSYGEDFGDIVTKTTAGYIFLDRSHRLIERKTQSQHQFLKIGRSACDQCSYCTEFCPRYLQGHPVQPHKVMRALLFSPESITEFSKWASGCVECGLCGLYSCPEDLSPHLICGFYKSKLRENKQMFEPDNESRVHPMNQYRKVSTAKLIRRLGIEQYDVAAPLLNEFELNDFEVKLLLSQHIGKPAVPIVKTGDFVKRGQLVAAAAEGGLSAAIHASVTGYVKSIDLKSITVKNEGRYP